MLRITRNGFCRTAAGVVAAFTASTTTVSLSRTPSKVIPILESKMKLDPATLALVRRATFSDGLVVAQIQPWIDMVAKYKRFPASDIIFHS
jgi:hypothetical protein